MDQLVPRKQQLEFISWEFGVMFSFGIRTFYEGHMDWDELPMPLEAFCPDELNCRQWMEGIRAAGATYAVLICKHHDGFANWPSKYTDYSVAHTSWRNGKGDVVREFTDACREYGIKVGLYYSPAEKGFCSRSSEEYDDYFINQVGELLQNYGQIDYLWFDGCGSEGHQYDEKKITRAIRGFQPNILIFNMWDPDTRWVGNEAGIAHANNTNQVDRLSFSIMTNRQDSLENLRFLPAECDCMLRSRSWFYSEYDTATVKSVEELMGLYCHSVGNGANLLLNVGPDRRGLIPQTDFNRLQELGREIRRCFGTPLSGRWEEDGQGGTLHLDQEELVNCVLLQEDITQGERISAYRVEISSGLAEGILVREGTAVGHKRILLFAPIRASSIQVVVTEGSEDFRLVDVAAFYLTPGDQ